MRSSFSDTDSVIPADQTDLLQTKLLLSEVFKILSKSGNHLHENFYRLHGTSDVKRIAEASWFQVQSELFARKEKNWLFLK
jgi:hypothetical protein